MLFGEPPTISVKDDMKEAYEKIDETNDIIDKIKMAVKDTIRFGDGLLHVFLDENKDVKLNVIPPSIWFPIVDAMNIKEVKYHVIANQECNDDDTTTLHVQVHSKGSYSKITYLVRDEKITRLIEVEENIPTGLRDFCYSFNFE